MSSSTSYSDFLRARVRSLVVAEEFDESVRAFSELARTGPLHPDELVQYARCLQLGSGEIGTLDEAEAHLRKALAIDERHVPALLELGWFLHAVRNDSAQALPHFERALREVTKMAEEARRGRQECLADLSAEVSDE